jgi:hypothetical protein
MTPTVQAAFDRYRGEASKFLVCWHRIYQLSLEFEGLRPAREQLARWIDAGHLTPAHLLDAVARFEAWQLGAGPAALDFARPFDWGAWPTEAGE